MRTTLPPPKKPGWNSPNKQMEHYLAHGCLDCDGMADHYMVSREVWEQAVRDDAADRSAAKAKGYTGVYLCFTCLESRLGRRLRLRDFPEESPDQPGDLHGFRYGCRTLGADIAG